VGTLGPHVAFAQPRPKGPKAPVSKAGATVPAPPAPVPPPPPAATAIPPLSETLNEGARREYEAAKALYGMGDSQGAFYKFQAAYELYADPRLLWNMATCAKNLHKYADALVLVRRYQKLGGALLAEEDRAEASAVERALASLTTTFSFKGVAPGTEVTVDEKPVEHPEEPFVADLGPHRITAKRAGFRDFSVSVTGRPLAETEVRVTLVPVVHEGTLIIQAGPKVTISVDGKVVALGSFRGKVSSGGHLVRVSAQGYRPFQQEIVLQDDETRTVPVVLDVEPSSGLPAWLWVAGGVVLTGVAIGTVAAVAGGGDPAPVDKSKDVPRGSIDPGYVFTRF